jgi:hypothetical protein
MTTTDLPPIGSMWVHKQNPQNIAIVVGYNTIQLKHIDKKHKLVKLHKVQFNTQDVEIVSTFTWLYKPLEQGQ